MMNLIQDAWIPVVRKDRTKDCIAPWEITTEYRTNPVVELDAPRSDFNGALIQFLIGIVQTSMPPADAHKWKQMFRNPPDEDVLRKSFSVYTDSFNLEGDGVRFMQDQDLTEGKPVPIARLLLEMPGENAENHNTDHFLKRGSVEQICLPCCAMALYSLQTNASFGGAGHRVSLRGGGPLTTLIRGTDLWETVWSNVVDSRRFLQTSPEVNDSEVARFPWHGHMEDLGKRKISPADVHPAQMFWGMPRRVHIQTESREGVCDLCGCTSDTLVSGYLTKPKGISYSEGWKHVLSPHTYDLKKGGHLPVHLQPGGISYRNWLGIVQNRVAKNAKDEGIWAKEPASVVSWFRAERHEILTEAETRDLRIWSFGYDMDKAKARCWYEGTMPLISVHPSIREKYESVTEKMILTADLVAKTTRDQIRKALFDRPADKKGDLKSIDSEFWQNTESGFYQTLSLVEQDLIAGNNGTEPKQQWLEILRNESGKLFEQYAQTQMIAEADPKRIARAWRDLRLFTSAWNKNVRNTLDIPKPERKVVS